MSTAILAPPDLEPLVRLVTDALPSPHSRRAYGRALREFGTWFSATQDGGMSRSVVQRYILYLQQTGRTPSSINLALAAVKRLAREAHESGLLPEFAYLSISRVESVKQRGQRAGNWLSRDEAARFLGLPDRGKLDGRRDGVLLGLMLGCGLRRSEAVSVTVEHLQERDGRPCIVDLVGKGNRIKTVAVPDWFSAEIEGWLVASGITTGRIIPLTEKTVWWVVKRYASALGKPHLAPHDLRRTFSKLAEEGGASLRQIQQQLGHSKLETTQRYLDRPDLRRAACDFLGIRPQV